MRYTELKTWEDFAKALSQEQNPARLTYLVERLYRALDITEPRVKDPLHPLTATQSANRRRAA